MGVEVLEEGRFYYFDKKRDPPPRHLALQLLDDCTKTAARHIEELLVPPHARPIPARGEMWYCSRVLNSRGGWLLPLWDGGLRVGVGILLQNFNLQASKLRIGTYHFPAIAPKCWTPLPNVPGGFEPPTLPQLLEIGITGSELLILLHEDSFTYILTDIYTGGKLVVNRDSLWPGSISNLDGETLGNSPPVPGQFKNVSETVEV
ncbi:hypothetical protein B0H19DRAFT_1061665 [Mycena capillaripes]|nr:hypothetical protein B0H19DRAFT_1061665 [Mycena capillaripes]